MELQDLKQIVSRLESLRGDDIKTIEGRFDLLSEARRAVKRLCFDAALELVLKRCELGESLCGRKEEGDEKRLKPVAKYQFLKDLNRFKPRRNRNEREAIALKVRDALFEVEVKVRQHLEANGFDEKGPLWPMWLLGLCNRYGNMRLQDFLDPAVPSRQNFSSLPSEYRSEWLEGVARGRFESFAVVGHEIIKEAERRQEKKRWESDHSVRPFANELNEIEPPLTWGEILFHYISVLTESRDREALKELDRFFPAERYCIECGQVFEVDKYNPRRFRCKKCSGRLRVRRYRAKQEPR